MKRVFRFIRYSSVGVFFAGIIGVIQGCSIQKEGLLAAVLLVLLQFCSGPIDEMGEDATDLRPIILYDSGRMGRGDIGDRPTSTNICAASPYKPPGYSRFIALLSYGGDLVKDFKDLPGFDETAPVTGPTGVRIGSNWADLFDGDILASMGAAIPTFTGGTVYWTGSTETGSRKRNCLDWTTSSSSTLGGRGSASRMDGKWMEDLDVACFGSQEMICVAY